MQEVLKTEIVSIDLMDFVPRPFLDPKILHKKNITSNISTNAWSTK